MIGRLPQRLQRLPRATSPRTSGASRSRERQGRPLPSSPADTLISGCWPPRLGEHDSVWSCYGRHGAQYTGLLRPPGQVGRPRAWGTWRGLGKGGYQAAGVACVQAPSLTWPSASRGTCPLPRPVGWVWVKALGLGHPKCAGDTAPAREEERVGLERQGVDLRPMTSVLIRAAWRRGTGRKGEAVWPRRQRLEDTAAAQGHRWGPQERGGARGA